MHSDIVQIDGRVKLIRRAGKAMFFLDVVQDGQKVQVCASNILLGMDKDDFVNHHTFIRKGDHISCRGHPSVTKVGEMTLKAVDPVTLCSPCLDPRVLNTMLDRLLINSQRVLNYLVSDEAKQAILVKSAVTKAIRDFFTERDYIEVQTPTLCGSGTGANANPFSTVSKALSEKVQLRVAPELWLKKLVVGGFDKVFEIGQNYRNEGVDASHNPEFTTCEFYRTFTSLGQLMEITEDLFAFIYNKLSMMQLPILQSELPRLGFLKKKFQRIEFIPGIEEKTGCKLPESLDTDSLLEYLANVGVKAPLIASPASLLDALSGEFLEKSEDGTPVFVYNQPAVMSPLAKLAVVDYGGRNYDVSMRFELFINGKEYVNSYEEENSPFDQADKFALQQQTKIDFNDQEALVPDWAYVEQMHLGLPPTGGWGCGIDRLSMLFSGSKRIEDVLTFGTLKDVIRQ